MAASNIFHRDGAGTATDSGNFRGTEVDLLMEKVLFNEGVVTLLGECKNYEISSLDEDVARADPDCLCLFRRGFLQHRAAISVPTADRDRSVPAVCSLQRVYPDGSSDRDEFETGVNYVIDGHNARVSLIYQYGDLSSKGIFNFGPDVRGDSESAVKLGIQLQL